MTWYCWATQAIMAVALTARHLAFHGAGDNRSADPGESAAGCAQPLVRTGINDEAYRRRIM
jgi:hypothetical protein